ncbi:hypothetical protein T4C_5398 [Trichinella pseudospiralis]|uniref:Apple domain-containing protein n=1 Tax=Trichinella pseudospiralis TaxID=6337 RepID=A0A0V1KDC1_TRIPS|nr:hypothetical protein T4C_5398 [Trichinella pseudospiralis]
MPCEFSKVVCSSYDTMLKQCSVLAIICFINCHLISCSWMSIYIPKMDVTCVLTAKIVDYDKDSYIRRVYCSMESCVAACLSHSTSCNLIKYSPFTKVCDLYFANATRHIVYPSDKIGQSMHFQLQSCHKNISTLPAGMVVQSKLQNNNSAIIHIPSTHKNCGSLWLPFVENYHAERIQLIAASSLKRCIAFCEAPTYTSCNSVLFSAQEGTCLLLFRSIRTQLFNGIAPTIQSSALFVVISECYDDFEPPIGYSLPNFGQLTPTVYSTTNAKVSLYHVHFYATTAAIRLRLWDTANEFECLILCLDNFLADHCDAYYFSHGEKTCLTFRLKEQHALPNSQYDRHIIKFSDNKMLIKIFKDQRLPSLKHLNHLAVETKVSLFQFKERCTIQHSVLTAIPRIKFIQQYVNISFLNDCISKCRFIRSSGLCEGIAYSKEKKACLIAVNGNNDDEVLLNGGYHFLTLHNCSKDREVERAHNDPPELHAFPLLDEICLVEFYKPLFVSGWSVIAEIRNTTSVQWCLLNCAAAMYANKCSAIYFIDGNCVLLERTHYPRIYFTRQKNYHAERIQLIAASSLKRCIAFCEAPTYTSCNSVLFSAQEGTCLLLFRSIRTQLFNGIAPTIQSSALFVAILACNDDFDPPFGNAIPNFRLIVPTAYSISNIKVSLYRAHFYATTAAIRLRLWDTANEFECLMICLDKFLADYCDGFYFSYEEKTCLTFRIREEYALPNSQHDRHIIRFAVDQMTIRIPRDLRLHSLMYSNHLTVEMKVPLHEFKEVCTVEHSILTAIPRIKFIQQYVNISFLNDCISKCRFIRSSGLCEGIAYSKEKKACLIAVNGNNDDEVLLNGGYHFLTLHNCSKDREVERAHNDPPELHAFPLLDEICLVEFYKPLFVSGWSVIAEIRNTTSVQWCLLNCAAAMYANKCSAIYFIDGNCVLLERTHYPRIYFTRQSASVFAELLFCEASIR